MKTRFMMSRLVLGMVIANVGYSHVEDEDGRKVELGIENMPDLRPSVGDILYRDSDNSLAVHHRGEGDSTMVPIDDEDDEVTITEEDGIDPPHVLWDPVNEVFMGNDGNDTDDPKFAAKFTSFEDADTSDLKGERFVPTPMSNA